MDHPMAYQWDHEPLSEVVVHNFSPGSSTYFQHAILRTIGGPTARGKLRGPPLLDGCEQHLRVTGRGSFHDLWTPTWFITFILCRLRYFLRCYNISSLETLFLE